MKWWLWGLGDMKDAIHHNDGNPLNNDLSNLRRIPIASSVADDDHKAAQKVRWDVAYSPAEMAAAYNRLRAMHDDLERKLAIVTADRDAGNEPIAYLHATSGHKDEWAELGATASFRAYHILRCIVEGAKPGTRGWEKLMINVRDTINQFEAKL